MKTQTKSPRAAHSLTFPITAVKDKGNFFTLMFRIRTGVVDHVEIVFARVFNTSGHARVPRVTVEIEDQGVKAGW